MDMKRLSPGASSCPLFEGVHHTHNRFLRWSELITIRLGAFFAPPVLLAASVPNFPPNPVGEKLYRSQLTLELLLPVGIVVCALLAAYVALKLNRKNQKPDSESQRTRL